MNQGKGMAFPFIPALCIPKEKKTTSPSFDFKENRENQQTVHWADIKAYAIDRKR